ncbi:MAG: hypothetical protein ACXVHB_05935 [Solirubrobacteraceae bacterium]
MSEIMLPRPENVRGRFGSYVTSDVFHIAERLQEVDTRLFIQAFDEPIHWHGRTYNFAVVEWVPERQRDELVMRVKDLDGRVIQAVERMRRIPFAKRFAEAEKLEAKWEAEAKERKLNELYERMGGNMLAQLDRCGFVQRPQSYAKRNPTARRHRNAKGLLGVPAR